MLLNFDFLFLILFSFLFFFFFFFLFFLLHTRTLTPNIYLRSLFDFLFFQLSIEHFSPSLSLSLSLSLTHTHTHTNFSPSISHKQILFHTCIDHYQRTKIRILPTSKNMQLNHHIGQIGVLHGFFFFFFGSGLISFILLFRFHQAYEKDFFFYVSNLLIGFLF